MYEPVSCEFYDQLNVIVQRKIPTSIIYLLNNEEVEIKGKLVEMTYENDEEFLILDSTFKIRLDLVLYLNGKKYKKDDS